LLEFERQDERTKQQDAISGDEIQLTGNVQDSKTKSSCRHKGVQGEDSCVVPAVSEAFDRSRENLTIFKDDEARPNDCLGLKAST